MTDPIHISEVREQDIVIDLDNERDAKAIDNGADVLRILIYKGGKRQVAWLHVGCHRNKAVLKLTAGKSGTETKVKIICQPWYKEQP